MNKGITGLDRAQLSLQVELVVGDEEVAGAPRILARLQAVRATLMYLRTNASQEAMPRSWGVCQPTICWTIAVIIRIITTVPGPEPATAEEIPHSGVYIIDGTPLPC